MSTKSMVNSRVDHILLTEPVVQLLLDPSEELGG